MFLVHLIWTYSFKFNILYRVYLTKNWKLKKKVIELKLN